jgi:hypothetical protein
MLNRSKNMQTTEKYNMIEECTDSYEVNRFEDGSVEVHIKIPKRFRSLWLVKLSDLETTDKEIQEYESEEVIDKVVMSEI